MTNYFTIWCFWHYFLTSIVQLLEFLFTHKMFWVFRDLWVFKVVDLVFLFPTSQRNRTAWEPRKISVVVSCTLSCTSSNIPCFFCGQSFFFIICQVWHIFPLCFNDFHFVHALLQWTMFSTVQFCSKSSQKQKCYFLIFFQNKPKLRNLYDFSIKADSASKK